MTNHESLLTKELNDVKRGANPASDIRRIIQLHTSCPVMTEGIINLLINAKPHVINLSWCFDIYVPDTLRPALRAVAILEKYRHVVAYLPPLFASIAEHLVKYFDMLCVELKDAIRTRCVVGSTITMDVARLKETVDYILHLPTALEIVK